MYPKFSISESGPGRPTLYLRSVRRWSAIERFIRVRILYRFIGLDALREPGVALARKPVTAEVENE